MSSFLLDPGLLVILGVIALVSFATEGAIGFGGTVLAASIGAQVADLEVLLPAFVPLNILMSSWLLSRGVRTVAWRLLLVEVVPAVAVGAAVGLALPFASWIPFAFGVFVVGLALFQLAHVADAALPRVAQLGFLALGGIAHGQFGTGGPMIVYVARRRLADKLAFRSTLAVLWLALNAALLTKFITTGLYHRPVFEVGGVLAVVIVPGLFIGDRIHRKLDAARFERVVWLVLLLAGGALAVRSAFAL
jgi:uncharacterized membrane protein YfcA